MADLGKALIAAGLVIALIGALLIVAGRTGLPIGRLPGDIIYRGKSVSVFIPLGTCVLLSIILSVIFYILSHFHR